MGRVKAKPENSSKGICSAQRDFTPREITRLETHFPRISETVHKLSYFSEKKPKPSFSTTIHLNFKPSDGHFVKHVTLSKYLHILFLQTFPQLFLRNFHSLWVTMYFECGVIFHIQQSLQASQFPSYTTIFLCKRHLIR